MRLAIACVVVVVLASRLAAAAPLELTAKVAEVPDGYGYCGTMAVWAVIRYEVIAVDRGQFADRDAFVVVLCPESYQVGTKHKLVLEPAKRGTYVDKLPGSAPRYRATKVTRA